MQDNLTQEISIHGLYIIYLNIVPFTRKLLEVKIVCYIRIKTVGHVS